MDELETLNMLLRAIGSSPVNSLATDHPNAGNAETTMKRISRRVQRKGWWCNIDYNIIPQPNADREIVVSPEISALVTANRGYVLRNRKLYNKLTQTSKFDSPVDVIRQTGILDWDDMPQVMQEYCAYYAAKEFVRDELEDPSKEDSFSESASASLLDLKKQDLEEGQYNIFHKARVQQARSGIQPYARSSTRFAGDPDV